FFSGGEDMRDAILRGGLACLIRISSRQSDHFAILGECEARHQAPHRVQTETCDTKANHNWSHCLGLEETFYIRATCTEDDSPWPFPVRLCAPFGDSPSRRQKRSHRGHRETRGSTGEGWLRWPERRSAIPQLGEQSRIDVAAADHDDVDLCVGQLV